MADTAPEPADGAAPRHGRRAAALRALLMAWAGGGSLHRQLLLWLLLPQLVLWLAAAAVTYNVALRYATRGIDASLLQASKALARQVKPVDNGLFIDFPRAAQDVLEADPDDRYYYMVSTPPGRFILGNRMLPQPPSGSPLVPGEPLFYDGLLDKTPIRLAALAIPIADAAHTANEAHSANEADAADAADARHRAAGAAAAPALMLVQVARSQASRNELARRILLDTVLPLSVLIGLMTMIVWAGIRAGLSPLNRLRALVQDRAPNDLAPLELTTAPKEVHALAKALNQLLAAVHESVAGQRRFISHAAHQLRTPLAGLKQQAEIALQANHDPALARRLSLVHESAVRSAHLVNQLLALTRAEPEAAAAMPRQPTELHQLVADVVAEAVPRALQAGIDLGLGALPAAAPVSAPIQVAALPWLLREAVANLVDNAIRYAGRGAEVTVSVGLDPAQPGPPQARIEVRDNGPGLSDELAGNAFEPFVRGTQEGKGCGLGLAIVREIAERHGGHAGLQPLQPHGLCAWIALPCSPVGIK